MNNIHSDILILKNNENKNKESGKNIFYGKLGYSLIRNVTIKGC